MTKTFNFTSKNNNNSTIFLNTKNTETNYSKILDNIILADIAKKNSYLFDDYNFDTITVDNKPIIVNSSYLKDDDYFIKATNFLSNFKKYKKYYTIPYEFGKMYTTADGTRIVFYDDEIQIGSLFYKYSDIATLPLLKTISEPTKNIIINIYLNGIKKLKITL